MMCKIDHNHSPIKCRQAMMLNSYLLSRIDFYELILHCYVQYHSPKTVNVT